jgi:hypothetical protein
LVEATTPTVSDALIDDIQARVSFVQGLGTIAYIRKPFEAGIVLKTTVEYYQKYDDATLSDIEYNLEQNIREFIGEIGIGETFSVNRLVSQMLLEREFEEFVTSEGEVVETSEGQTIESKFLDESVILSWVNKFNHTYSNQKELDTRDELLLLKVLKHLYANKGTHKAIEIFFEAYFGETVEVYLPKFDICYIDNNFLLDDLKKLRDDDVYQEYSYVIYVINEPDFYRKEFEDIYLKNFHPGGFKVTLLKR